MSAAPGPESRPEAGGREKGRWAEGETPCGEGRGQTRPPGRPGPAAGGEVGNPQMKGADRIRCVAEEGQVWTGWVGA